MIRITRESSCEAYTRMLGAGIASIVRGGDTVTLSGGLGAGKTTLTRAIVSALGVPPQAVSSPTFVFINEYAVPAGDAAAHRPRRVAHVDAYRLDEASELGVLGWDRYFAQDCAHEDVLAIIEWPERLGASRPAPAMEIAIETTGQSTRHFEITMPDPWSARLGMDQFLQREPARCRVTGVWISPTHPTYPFADSRARDADLHRWFSGQYRISREATADDTGEPGVE
ncbi:MAG: hypothetical protein AMXMBFR58_11940 [Phycisphaerae bacterium]